MQEITRKSAGSAWNLNFGQRERANRRSCGWGDGGALERCRLHTGIDVVRHRGLGKQTCKFVQELRVTAREAQALQPARRYARPEWQNRERGYLAGNMRGFLKRQRTALGLVIVVLSPMRAPSTAPLTSPAVSVHIGSRAWGPKRVCQIDWRQSRRITALATSSPLPGLVLAQ